MLMAITARVKTVKSQGANHIFDEIAARHGAVLRRGDRWESKNFAFNDLVYYAPPDGIDALLTDLRGRNEVVRAEPSDGSPPPPHMLFERRSGLDRRRKPRPDGPPDRRRH